MLEAPAHLRGRIRATSTNQSLRDERLAWACEQRNAGYRIIDIGRALGIGKSSAARMLERANPPPRRHTRSSDFKRLLWKTEMKMGQLFNVIDALPFEQSELLLFLAARRRITVAEVVVALALEGLDR